MYPRDDFVDVVLNGTPDLYGKLSFVLTGHNLTS